MATHSVRMGLVVMAMSVAPCLAQITPPPSTGPATSTAPATHAAAAGPSRDLREMSAKVAAAIQGCKPISESPFRVTIVVKGLDNKTEDMAGQDLNVYVVKLAGALNMGAGADRVMFVQQAAGIEGRPDAPPPGNARIVPQYALTGTLHSMTSNEKTYYMFDLRLTDFGTGAQIWAGQFDVATLN